MVLAVVGALVPLAAFLPWLSTYGVDVPRFLADLFANPVSRFFGWDVILSAIVLTVFILVQGRRDSVRPLWLPVTATFLIGVSCGLPLFLAMREIARGRRSVV
ncbi:DUF2834 domain-containing protein [Sphingobium aquiterrae]|uniref:DUF2834 domain-containing protein n=1 Tax=Sphingobium aquiterrae TaxID=2038656 RepID=UPI0030196D5F